MKNCNRTNLKVKLIKSKTMKSGNSGLGALKLPNDLDCVNHTNIKLLADDLH